MGHIFISYSHKDKAYVHRLQEALQSEGFDAWIDDRIDYGARWPKVIQDQLDACDAFIVVVSENSYESEWVQNEVARATRKRKPFFPLLLNGDTWLSIESTQYVDVTSQELPPKKFYERLSKVTSRRKVASEPERQNLTRFMKYDEKDKLTKALLQDYWEQLGTLLETYYKNGAPSAAELQKIEEYVLKIEKFLDIPRVNHIVGGGSTSKTKSGRPISPIDEDAPPAPKNYSEERWYRTLLVRLDGNFRVAEGMIAVEARVHPTLTREELIERIVNRLERYQK